MCKYFRHTSNRFDAVFYAPHPVRRTEFDARAVAQPLYLAARFRGEHDQSIAVARDPHRARHTLTGLAKRREGKKLLVAQGCKCGVARRHRSPSNWISCSALGWLVSVPAAAVVVGITLDVLPSIRAAIIRVSSQWAWVV